jgi:hypothetical protein
VTSVRKPAGSSTQYDDDAQEEGENVYNNAFDKSDRSTQKQLSKTFSSDQKGLGHGRF